MNDLRNYDIIILDQNNKIVADYAYIHRPNGHDYYKNLVSGNTHMIENIRSIVAEYETINRIAYPKKNVYYKITGDLPPKEREKMA